jgi:hypothetical protein
VPNSSRTEMQRRIGDIIHEYEAQGFHRAGTEVDQISGDRLVGRVREIGLEPIRVKLVFKPGQSIDASLIANGRRLGTACIVDGGFGTAASRSPRDLNSDAPYWSSQSPPKHRVAAEFCIG